MSIISRLTTWTIGQVLKAADLNGEFNNITNLLNNLDAGTTSWTNVKGGILSGSTITVASITFTSTTGIVGTTTNNSAAAGSVGEVVTSVVTSAGNTGANGAWADVTSISLTAGDWDVFGTVTGISNGATWTRINCGLGTTSGNNAPTGGLINYNKDLNTWASSSTTPLHSTSSDMDVFQLASPATVYLKVSADFSLGQPQATGYIIARRAR